MLSLQSRTLDTLSRSQAFLVANVAVVGDLSQSSAYQALDTAIAELTTQAANQTAGQETSVATTATLVALRQTLRVNFMTPIATIAKAQAGTLPDLATLRMPPVNATVARLVADSSAMAERVTANLAVFTGAGLPADIATQLLAAANAVTAAAATRAASNGRRTQGTAGLASAAKAGMTALRILNTIVTPTLTGTPLLAVWKSDIKVSAKSGASAGTVVPGPVPAPVTAATPATMPAAPTVAPCSPATAEVHTA